MNYNATVKVNEKVIGSFLVLNSYNMNFSGYVIFNFDVFATYESFLNGDKSVKQQNAPVRSLNANDANTGLTPESICNYLQKLDGITNVSLFNSNWTINKAFRVYLNYQQYAELSMSQAGLSLLSFVLSKGIDQQTQRTPDGIYFYFSSVDPSVAEMVKTLKLTVETQPVAAAPVQTPSVASQPAAAPVQTPSVASQPAAAPVQTPSVASQPAAPTDGTTQPATPPTGK